MVVAFVCVLMFDVVCIMRFDICCCVCACALFNVFAWLVRDSLCVVVWFVCFCL